MQKSEGAMEAVDDGSLDMFGLTAQRLNEREPIKCLARSREYIASWLGPCVPHQA